MNKKNLDNFMPNVIITDGLWRKSLSAVRSVGKAKYPVTVMGDSWFTTSFWSKFTYTRYLAPLASVGPDQFGKSLFTLLERYPQSVIFPMEDPSLMWVANHQSEILSKGCHCLLPPLKSLEIAQDKGQTLLLAQELGFPCPKTWQPKDLEEFLKTIQTVSPENFIVKPLSGTGSSGFSIVRNQDSDHWKNHWKKFGPLLIQERIPPEGKGQGVSILMDSHGNCVAAFAHERLQQYPNFGGPSTDRQSIHAPKLIEMSVSFLKKLSWKGIAMVEWKIDPRDHQPKLMEINPRFWGSLELAIRSGIDFPKLFVQASLNQPLPPAEPYPAGIRCRWMIPGEILRYLTQAPRDRESIWKFLEGLPRLAEEWDPQDWKGSIATVICIFAKVFHPRYWKYLLRKAS